MKNEFSGKQRESDLTVLMECIVTKIWDFEKEKHLSKQYTHDVDRVWYYNNILIPRWTKSAMIPPIPWKYYDFEYLPADNASCLLHKNIIESWPSLYYSKHQRITKTTLENKFIFYHRRATTSDNNSQI